MVTRDGVLEELVEVKWSEKNIAPALKFYSEKLNPQRALQIVGKGVKPYKLGKIRVVDAVEEMGGW